MTAHGNGTREDALSTFLHGEGGFSPECPIAIADNLWGLEGSLLETHTSAHLVQNQDLFCLYFSSLPLLPF